jgi:hypothetical protein
MIDYLLKFSSKRTAHTFAYNYGFASVDPITDKVSVINNSSDYAFIEIGEHYVGGEETLDENNESTIQMIGDNNYWVTLRLMSTDELPTSVNKYVVWSSLQGLPRPKNNPDIPNINWA